MRLNVITALILGIYCLNVNAQVRVHADGRTSIHTLIKDPRNLADLYMIPVSNADWDQSMCTEVTNANTVNYVVRLNGVDQFYVTGNGSIWSIQSMTMYPHNGSARSTSTKPVEGALDKILGLEGAVHQLAHKSESAIGQDENMVSLLPGSIEEKIPQAVKTTPDGRKGVSYNQIVTVLVEAFKDQHEEVESLRKQIKEINDKLKINTEHNKSSLGNRLLPSRPNPFSDQTVIEVELVEGVLGEVQIHDIQGRLIKTYSNIDQSNNEIRVRGQELEQGTYTYSLVVDGEVIDTKQMILTK